MNVMKRLVPLILASYLIIQASISYAQVLPGTIGGVEPSASINSPLPGQSVTITAQSYSIDINTANITWTSAGKVIGKGLGLTKVTVQAPDLGKRLTVNISVVSPNGDAITGSYVISSG